MPRLLPAPPSLGPRPGRRSGPALTLALRQLAGLLEAGLPLVAALESVRRAARDAAVAEAAAHLRQSILGGRSLAAACGLRPRLFDAQARAMLAAGEQAGQLHAALDQLAGLREARARLARRLRGAMVYPAVVLGAATLIVGLLLAFVVPQFQKIFASLLQGRPLPWPTQVVVGLGELVRHPPAWLWLGLPCLYGLGLALRRTTRGQRLVARCGLHLPLIGALWRAAAAARFLRCLGNLLGAGVPLVQALEGARAMLGQAELEGRLRHVTRQVGEGLGVAPALEQAGVCPPELCALLAVGEETGRLGEYARRAAIPAEESVEATVEALTAALEPLLIVGLSLVVGGLVVALFLPMVEVMRQLGSGR